MVVHSFWVIIFAANLVNFVSAAGSYRDGGHRAYGDSADKVNVGRRMNDDPRIADTRIVGGRPTAEGECPHQAALYYEGNQNCGGAIVNTQWILTAAHCVRGLTLSAMIVGVGSNEIKTRTEEIYMVTKGIVHEKFKINAGFPTYDIALLKLAGPIAFRVNRVMPIELADETPRMGSLVSVSGFGLRYEDEPVRSNNRLMLTDLMVFPLDGCQETIRKKIKKNPVFGTDQFCAGDMEHPSDACQGDSGGPVTQGGKLVGIVSWGVGCGRPGLPGFYTSVAPHKAWIYRTIQSG